MLFTGTDLLHIVIVAIRAVTALLVILMGLSEWRRTRRETFRFLSLAFVVLVLQQVGQGFFRTWSTHSGDVAPRLYIPVLLHLAESIFLVLLAYGMAAHESGRKRELRRVTQHLLRATVLVTLAVQAVWYLTARNQPLPAYEPFWGERLLDVWDMGLLGVGIYLAAVLEPEIQVLPALYLLVLGKAADLTNALLFGEGVLSLHLFNWLAEAAAAIFLLAAAHFGIVTETFTDPLTRLYNRRYFTSRVAEEFTRACRRRTRLSVLVMDLDHFKRFNDTHGHVAGDKLLRWAAKVLNRQLRPYDILCRWGGEEFIALLPDTGTDDASAVAERLRRAIADTLGSPERPTPVTISIGVAVGPGPSGDWREVVEAADEAMYKAKRWRNRVALVEMSHR